MANPEHNQPEREHGSFPSTREDLRALVERNSGTQILNATRYDAQFGSHAQKFAFEKCDKMRLVRVKTPQGIQWFLEDGHHRAKAADTYLWKTNPQNPEKQAEVLSDKQAHELLKDKFVDVIDDVLLDLKERDKLDRKEPEKRTYLTMREYLHAIAPATRAQEAVAAKRAARYVLSGWENFIEKERAEKFSTLAALYYLEREENEPDIPFFPGETATDREILQKSLADIDELVRDMYPKREDVLKETNAFIFTQLNNDERAKQLVGLRYLSGVQQKLASFTFKEREDGYELLSKTLAKRALSGTRGVKDLTATQMPSIIEGLDDPKIPFDKTLEIIMADSPSSRLEKIQTALAKEEVEHEYEKRFGAQPKGVANTLLIRFYKEARIEKETRKSDDTRTIYHLVNEAAEIVEAARLLTIPVDTIMNSRKTNSPELLRTRLIELKTEIVKATETTTPQVETKKTPTTIQTVTADLKEFLVTNTPETLAQEDIAALRSTLAELARFLVKKDELKPAKPTPALLATPKKQLTQPIKEASKKDTRPTAETIVFPLTNELDHSYIVPSPQWEPVSITESQTKIEWLQENTFTPENQRVVTQMTMVALRALINRTRNNGERRHFESEEIDFITNAPQTREVAGLTAVYKKMSDRFAHAAKDLHLPRGMHDDLFRLMCSEYYLLALKVSKEQARAAKDIQRAKMLESYEELLEPRLAAFLQIDNPKIRKPYVRELVQIFLLAPHEEDDKKSTIRQTAKDYLLHPKDENTIHAFVTEFIEKDDTKKCSSYHFTDLFCTVMGVEKTDRILIEQSTPGKNTAADPKTPEKKPPSENEVPAFYEPKNADWFQNYDKNHDEQEMIQVIKRSAARLLGTTDAKNAFVRIELLKMRYYYREDEAISLKMVNIVSTIAKAFEWDEGEKLAYLCSALYKEILVKNYNDRMRLGQQAEGYQEIITNINTKLSGTLSTFSASEQKMLKHAASLTHQQTDIRNNLLNKIRTKGKEYVIPNDTSDQE